MMIRTDDGIEIRVKGAKASNWNDVEYHTLVANTSNKHMKKLIKDIENVIKGRGKFKLPQQ